MLTIRREQLRALGSIARRGFEATLVSHFYEFFPQECEALGRAQATRVVQAGIARATPLGYRDNREIGLYINLMFMLGASFEDDPQIPWAGEQVRDLSVDPPFHRIQRAFRSALDYLGETSGEDNRYLVRAMIRIRDHEPPVATADPLSDDELFDLLGKLYPQKRDFQGPEPTRALIRMARERIAALGFTGGGTLTVFVVLMFMLGAGFDTDPLYPWAGEVLADPSFLRESLRIRALYRAAMEHLSVSLTHQPHVTQ